MAKKSHNKQVEETRLIAWYKWEFLRRNPNYRKDYDAFIDEFRSWFRKHGYWYDETRKLGPLAFRFFAEVIAPRAKTICERWQIRDPFSPKWKFEKSGFRRFKRHFKISLPTDCSEEEAGQVWNLSEFLLSDEEFRKCLPEFTAIRYGPDPDYHLELVFDLRLPLPFLLRKAEDRISSLKRAYDRRQPLKRKTISTVRRRLDLYDDYLRVWDLRAGGATFPAIGGLLFPGALTASQRAADSFKSAERLILGGYKELR